MRDLVPSDGSTSGRIRRHEGRPEEGDTISTPSAIELQADLPTSSAPRVNAA